MKNASSVGRVACVSMRGDSGVPKFPQTEINIGAHGVTGDFHEGQINKHKKVGAPEPNSRQLTIVAKEALDHANSQLDISLIPGSVGENILVENLGLLENLVAGDQIFVGKNVALRVTGQNRPCATLNVYHEDIIRVLLGIRGVTAVVEHPGTVSPGDRVVLKSPS